MSTKDFIAAFDFDGVIWNSVNECFHVASNVYATMKTPPDAPREHLARQFRKGRYLVKSGDDFYLLMHILAENPQVDFDSFDYSRFVKLRRELSDEMKSFTAKFYQERHRLQEENFDNWASLQGPFEEVVSQFPEIRETFQDTVICTTKDANSVEKLLATRGLDMLVLGRELSTYKPDQIEHICRQYEIAPGKILFVDDLLENPGTSTKIRRQGSHGRMGIQHPCLPG